MRLDPFVCACRQSRIRERWEQAVCGGDEVAGRDQSGSAEGVQVAVDPNPPSGGKQPQGVETRLNGEGGKKIIKFRNQSPMVDSKYESHWTNNVRSYFKNEIQYEVITRAGQINHLPVVPLCSSVFT